MLEKFLQEQQLPKAFADTAEKYFVPLAKQLATKTQTTKPLFIGINGCQGSGKSTLTAFLTSYLNELGLSVVNVSLDDFYHSKAKRIELSKTIHPLLKTRGVPGTHNTALLKATLNKLKTNIPTPLPSFSKADDDCVPANQWPISTEHNDIVLVEGWCWGTPSQEGSDLTAAINKLEATSDQDCRWRNYVNLQLKEQYQPLYSLFNVWIMLQAPSFNSVHAWRWQQEQKLAAKHQGQGVMSEVEVANFIQYYQRLTEHSLKSLPPLCDYVFQLDNNRHIVSVAAKDAL